MIISKYIDEGASALYDLVRFSEKAEESERIGKSRLQRGVKTDGLPSTSLGLETTGILNSYASPLTSLRERDLKALAVLFDRSDNDLIEEEIIKYLMLLWPEPCWEDDFSFLEEYL